MNILIIIIKVVVVTLSSSLEYNAAAQAADYNARSHILHGARTRNEKISSLVQEPPEVTTTTSP